MPRRTHSHATTSITTDERCRLTLACADDGPETPPADITDLLAFLFHAGAGQVGSLQEGGVEVASISLTQHGQVVVNGTPMPASVVLAQIADGLRVTLVHAVRAHAHRHREQTSITGLVKN